MAYMTFYCSLLFFFLTILKIISSIFHKKFDYKKKRQTYVVILLVHTSKMSKLTELLTILLLLLMNLLANHKKITSRFKSSFLSRGLTWMLFKICGCIVLNIWCSRMFPADQITPPLRNMGRKNGKDKLRKENCS